MKRLATLLLCCLSLTACNKENINQLHRDINTYIGKDMRVSYIDGGQVVKTWTVKDGKITAGKNEAGFNQGYYYFWSVETGYVQTPIERTVIEEIH